MGVFIYMGYTTPKLKYIILFMVICLLTACSKSNDNAYQSEIEGFVYKTKYCYQSQIHTTQQQFQRTLKLAKQNNPNAEYLIGLAYYYGINTSADKNLGMQYLLKASKRNNDKAMFMYGTILMQSQNKKDVKEAISWLKKAKGLGNVYASVNLNLLKISNLENNNDKHLKLLYKEAQQSGYAQFSLGSLLTQINNTNDIKKGTALLKKSFNNSNTSMYIKSKAATQLSLIYYEQNNKAQATYWRKKAQEILEQYGCTKQTSSEIL